MGRKQKVQKVNKNQKNLQCRRISQPCENFRNAGNFRKVAKISQRCEISQTLRNSQFAKMAGIFAGVAKISTHAKMTASLFLASAISKLCFDDLLSALFLH